MVLDENGFANVAYWNEGNGGLWYATNELGFWQREEVDSSSYVGKYPAIALDSTGNVHIAYLYEYFSIVSAKELRYATNTSGVWENETVDNTNFVGEYSSIVIDASNTVYISYFDLTRGELKYAYGAAGSWTIEAIDTEGYVGMYTSMALDSQENLHICYHGWTTDLTTSFLRYANNTAGYWSTETVNSGGKVGKYSSIALDSKNNVHISYFDEGNSTLRYAYAVKTDYLVTPSMHDFGDVRENMTSASLEVRITNTGAFVLDITLSDTENFSLDVNGGSSPCTSTTPKIALGNSGTVTIRFTPSSVGSFNASLTIDFADPDITDASIIFNGRGVEADGGDGDGGDGDGGGGGCFIATTACY